MIGKFFSRVIKELTPADTTPVTFNATGNYNPRYGKQHIYVSGKGGAGTYVSGTANYNTIGGNAEYNTVTGSDVYNPSNYVPASSGGVDTGTTNQKVANIYGSTVNETSFTPGNYVNSVQGPVNAGTPNAAGYNIWYTAITYQYYVAIAFSPGNTAATYNSSNQNYNAAASGARLGYIIYTYGTYFLTYSKGSPYTTNTATVTQFTTAYNFSLTYNYLYIASDVPSSNSGSYVQTSTSYTEPRYTAKPASSTVYGYNYSAEMIGYGSSFGTGTYNTQNISTYNTPTTYSAFDVMQNVVNSYHIGSTAFTQLGTYKSTNTPTYPYSYSNSPTYAYGSTNADTFNTGPSTNVFGVAITGGYGGNATAISPTLSTTPLPVYGVPISITVPTGGYVTITFTL